MLKAAWLGHWKAPWGLDRGRRWGDPAWALAAISQAWLLGGREGRWPRLEHVARRPQGPAVAALPTEFTPRPDPTWVALLRHGSSQISADQRHAKEDEAQAWAWEALLAGDGTPWMALGSLRVDLATRLRWVAVLGAVDERGSLHLPPYLASLVPGPLLALPPGWWETLLRSQDGEGRLLPEGALDPTLPWSIIQPLSEPVLLPVLPEALSSFHTAPWLFDCKELGWVLDPALRAWARGRGASPPGLFLLVPPGLAQGGAPDTTMTALLHHQVPEGLPQTWAVALEADFREGLIRPDAPPPSGQPTLDRLRMRWGGDPPTPEPGYPAWGTLASPCADPFHWMVQGRLFAQACEPQSALRAFTLAYAHFQRLGATEWAYRAASNAASMALGWADLPAYRRWAALRGPMPSHLQDLEETYLSEVYEDPADTLKRIRKLMAAYPDFTVAWEALASFGADHEQWELVREALPRIRMHTTTTFLEAALGNLEGPAPAEADPETRLNWEAHRLLRGTGNIDLFWAAWETCPSQLQCLELGVLVLERRPEWRRVGRLLGLQAIADRADSTRHRQRLANLWPAPELQRDPSAAHLLETWLSHHATPVWLVWEDHGQMRRLGSGDPPPEGALGRLLQEGTLPAFQEGPWVWRGHGLTWEGATVGAVLLALPADAPLESPLEPLLLAPWLAQLRGAEPPPVLSEAGFLWTDGSEPMASVLRELDRVASSDLSLLILGPTGSGKELAAREIHLRSGRRGSLVAVNCSAFAEGVMESELFGHTKGAFTGADRDRRGAIEAARGGTLFLDEVADLSPRLQSLLLRVIQEREVRRVGSDHAVKVDVRFLAATHRPIDDLADDGSFRRDLLYRLQGAVLHLPPLAARRHEFPFLVPRLVARVAEQAKRPIPSLAPGLSEALARLPWPGNVRELLHALERAILRCEGGILKPGHFPELDSPMAQPRTWEDANRAFQRHFLLDTLKANGFSMADTAQTLGFARPALYALAKRLGVDLVAERAAHRKQG
jgi:hypothetical protein